VNYRGSSGYGKAFLEAGKQEWSGKIEDDVELAVEDAIRRGLADPERICIAGASYGGYSALVSAMRQTVPYRCVASLNGPTDIPFIFESSDFATTEAGRESFAEIVGDPKTQRARLLEISPAYHVERLEAPVLIGVSTFDRRVDPDHAYRLRLMLEAHDKPFEWLTLPATGHAVSLPSYERYAFRLRDFVREHLARDRDEAR
jgi:dipeptidyl aminopeptidase/acylaminoacyl peptidase